MNNQKTERVFNSDEVDDYNRKRESIDKYIEGDDIEKKFLKKTEFKSEQTGNIYVVEIYNFINKVKQVWNYSLHKIYRKILSNKEEKEEKLELITEIKRNYSFSPLCLIDHPNGTDYMFISEDYNGGYTILDLDNLVEYVFLPNSWCIAEINLSKDKTKLIATGCYWGSEYWSRILDFSNPPTDKQSFSDDFKDGLKIVYTSELMFTFDKFSEDGTKAVFCYEFGPVDERDHDILKDSYEMFKKTIPNVEIVVEKEEETCDNNIDNCMVDKDKRVDKNMLSEEEWNRIHYYCNNEIKLIYAVNL